MDVKSYINGKQNQWELYGHPLYLKVLAELSHSIAYGKKIESIWFTSEHVDQLEQTFSDVEMVMRLINLNYELVLQHEIDSHKELYLNIYVDDIDMNELYLKCYVDTNKMNELKSFDDSNKYKRFYYIKYLFLNDIIQDYLSFKEYSILTISMMYDLKMVEDILNELNLPYEFIEGKNNLHYIKVELGELYEEN